MVGGEALYLNLKSQPKGDDLPPVDFTPLQRDQIPIEEDTEEKIKVILQSKKWGEQTYRMAMDKPFGTVFFFFFFFLDTFPPLETLVSSEHYQIRLF